ncbi:hypothetical protein HYH03_003813 [Edaphochlamys debaryana]|uniref:F-box domain-containing protein n=1 Tax=Edaphochlamys debaryana TaxID=47281 RepID=A0A835YAS1_9CHLO|nr:hypothetical protein HYH03_003813 [Edaphochlamys debaryana]|eukprot:KAG2498052.1 hypothetical protein HYH03_003813 [Edaphochlamys debaryana]
MEVDTEASIHRLDDGLLHAILSRLQPWDLARAECVCRRWRIDIIQSLWPDVLEDLEPSESRHEGSWLAQKSSAAAYVGWRLKWMGLLPTAEPAPSLGPTTSSAAPASPTPSSSTSPASSPSSPTTTSAPDQPVLAIGRTSAFGLVPLELVTHLPGPRGAGGGGAAGGAGGAAGTGAAGSGAGSGAAAAGAGARGTEAVHGGRRFVHDGAPGLPEGSVRLHEGPVWDSDASAPPSQPCWAPGGTRLAATARVYLGEGEPEAAARLARPAAFVIVNDRHGRRLLQVRLRDGFAPFFYTWSCCGNYLAFLSSWFGRRVMLRVLDLASALGPARGPPRLAYVGTAVPLYLTWCPHAPRAYIHTGRHALALWDAAAPSTRWLDCNPAPVPAPSTSASASVAAPAQGPSPGPSTSVDAGPGPGGPSWAWLSPEPPPPVAPLSPAAAPPPPAAPSLGPEPQWRTFLAASSLPLACAPEWFLDPAGRSRLLLPLAIQTLRALTAAAAELDAGGAAGGGDEASGSGGGGGAGGASGGPRVSDGSDGAGGLASPPLGRRRTVTNGGGGGAAAVQPVRLALGAAAWSALKGRESDPERPVGSGGSGGGGEGEGSAEVVLLALDPGTAEGPVGAASLLATLPPGSPHEELFTSVSPDGRLLAWARGSELRIVDLSGPLAGPAGPTCTSPFGSPKGRASSSYMHGLYGSRTAPAEWVLWPPPAAVAAALGGPPSSPSAGVVGLQWAPRGHTLLAMISDSLVGGWGPHSPSVLRHIAIEMGPGRPGPGPGPGLLRPLRLVAGDVHTPDRGFEAHYLPFLDQYLAGRCPSLELWSPDGLSFCRSQWHVVYQGPGRVALHADHAATLCHLRPVAPAPDAGDTGAAAPASASAVASNPAAGEAAGASSATAAGGSASAGQAACAAGVLAPAGPADHPSGEQAGGSAPASAGAGGAAAAVAETHASQGADGSSRGEPARHCSARLLAGRSGSESETESQSDEEEEDSDEEEEDSDEEEGMQDADGEARGGSRAAARARPRATNGARTGTGACVSVHLDVPELGGGVEVAPVPHTETLGPAYLVAYASRPWVWGWGRGRSQGGWADGWSDWSGVQGV